MKVAITGEKGFLGVHLTNYFKNILKYEVISLGKNYLNNLDKLKDLDWLVIAAFVHRNPEKGKVKTRLAKTVGDDKALAIYIALMEHTRKIAEALPTQRYLF